MKAYAVLALLLVVPVAHAAEIPDWVKTSAGWWAEGAIPDDEFARGIAYLIGEGFIDVEIPESSGAAGGGIPDWVRSSAGWWAEGAIPDSDFASGIGHLVSVGVIVVDAGRGGADGGAADGASMDGAAAGGAMDDMAAMDGGAAGGADTSALEAELLACEELRRALERSECREDVQKRIDLVWYRANSEPHRVGSVVFYYPGLGTEGNEIQKGSTPVLTVRILAENTGSENVVLACTGPSICSYDVWDGERAFKFSGMDFTSGQIVLRPGDWRVFNMLFGPNIGYGGTEFEYDPSREYVFRISEPWGGAQIPIR
ncbi:MAG: peptidase [Nitrosopumilus sp.]|nr:peptidase [Nitrosopumilus sp.]